MDSGSKVAMRVTFVILRVEKLCLCQKLPTELLGNHPRLHSMGIALCGTAGQWLAIFNRQRALAPGEGASNCPIAQHAHRGLCMSRTARVHATVVGGCGPPHPVLVSSHS